LHNIWGSDRNEDNSCVLLRYDSANWMRGPLSTPLSQHKFTSPVMYQFGFSETKKEEMAAQIQRYGTKATGIGRIIIEMGRSRIFREPEALTGPNQVTQCAESSLC